jgi:hypothetical protein
MNKLQDPDFASTPNSTPGTQIIQRTSITTNIIIIAKFLIGK